MVKEVHTELVLYRIQVYSLTPDKISILKTLKPPKEIKVFEEGCLV